MEGAILKENLLYLGHYGDVIEHLNQFKKENPESSGCNLNCELQNLNCSVKMADDVNLCLWHRYRVGSYTKITCGCKLWTILLGDRRSKQLAMKYYGLNLKETPLISNNSELKCCDFDLSEGFYKCGIMLICKEHIHNHAVKI